MIMSLEKVLALFGAVLSLAQGQIDTTRTYTGEATCYAEAGTFVRGNCSFDPQEVPQFYAAINGAQYNNAEWCGAWVEVTGPGGTAQVKIVDQCPECAFGDLDFNEEAFVQITGSTNGCDGRYDISWKWISSPQQDPLRFYSEGSNSFFLKLQVGNPVNPVSKMEIFVDGSYRTMGRTQDNHYLYNGAYSSDDFSIRLTDIFGEMIETDGLDLALVAVENLGQSGITNFTPQGGSPDADNDGLPDAWEEMFNINGLDPTADSDGDGILEIFEFVYGLNPNVSDGASSRPLLINRNQADWLSLQYRRSEEAAGSLTVQVETSTTLGSWSAVGVVQDFAEEDLGSGVKLITARVPIGAGDDLRFLRVSVVR